MGDGITHDMTRRDALKVKGGGLAALAVGLGIDPERTEALGTIRLGVHPYYFAGDFQQDGIAQGFRAFANAMYKKPYFLSSWTDFNKTHLNILWDWRDEDILSAVRNLGVHLQLNLEVQPAGTKTYADLWNGALTKAGINADTYVVNVSRHLKSWTEETGHTVPVRLLHEFNRNDDPWDGPTNMKRLWNRWVTILRGGEINAKLAAIGQPALRTTKTVGVNNNLRFVWNALIGGNLGRNWSDWWPGNSWVDQCGADMYHSAYAENRASQFDLLRSFNRFAIDHGKSLAIPEFNWWADAGDDRPGPVREFLDWMIAHANRITYASQFEAWGTFAVVNGETEHPELKALYRDYYADPLWEGDA